MRAFKTIYGYVLENGIIIKGVQPYSCDYWMVKYGDAILEYFNTENESINYMKQFVENNFELVEEKE